MLVLSRKAGEQIKIGDNVTVEVRRVAGNRVTIALHAPKDVRILRGELQEAAESFEPAEKQAVEETPTAIDLANETVTYTTAIATA